MDFRRLIVWARMNRQNFRRWAFRIWIFIFTLVVISGLHDSRNLQQENRNRIQEIQESRTTGCKSIYESIRQVFKPFFPPKAHRTAKQTKDLNKFNNIIDNRKRLCIKQVKSKPNRR